MAEVVSSWLQYDMAESCQIGTSCAYEVVPNWHNSFV